MFARSKRGASGNNKEWRLSSRRDDLGISLCRDYQSFSNLERPALFAVCKSLQPITRKFLGPSAKFLDKLLGIIARPARNFESQSLASGA